MPFDSFTLAAVAGEIREVAQGQLVKIYQPSPQEATLHFRAERERRVLYVSVHPEHFRIHFIEETPENPQTPPQFCMVLRKHLEGARLIEVEQPGLERVLKLRFSRSDGERTLIAEMMGKHSNLVLVGDNGMILDAIKHVSGRVNRVRELLPARLYMPPPPAARPDPLTASHEELEATVRGIGEKITPRKMVGALANIGPFAAAEVIAHADSPDPDTVLHALNQMMERIRAGEFSPTLLLDEEGRPTDAWAFASQILSPERQDDAPTMSAALEICGLARDTGSNIELQREEAQNRLSDLIEREERRIEEMRAALTQAERSEEYRIRGELIQGNAHAIERGQTEAELLNYYDPEQKTVSIELDPTLSPQENAEAYFRKHRKAKSSVPMLEERIATAEERRQGWQALLEEAQSADSDRLKAILAGMERAAPEREGKQEASEAVRRPAPGVRRTVSSDGYEIWYGEHKEGNDTLTSRLASPNDLWLHVRAGASAHVVIRTNKKPEEVPHRTLLEAAKIAVAHSDSKHSGMTPVDYTLKKYVRKPRGSGPGKAFYTHEKTLHIESGD